MRHQYESECGRAYIRVNVYDEQDAEIIQVWTAVPARRQGLQRELMRQVLEDADREGLSLLLNVGQGRKEGMSHEELWDWYDRLGFQGLAGNRMERFARVTTEVTSD